MRRSITIGRWTADLHQRAIHITREPKAKSNCGSCAGQGGHGWITPGGDADWEDCHCVSQLRTWRLPLLTRSTATEEHPF